MNTFYLSVDCGRHKVIPNGYINFANTSTTYGQSVSVICNRGYILMGGTSIECLSDGSWSEAVSCEIVGMYILRIAKTICFLLKKKGI